jgi:hypothetical protein
VLKPRQRILKKLCIREVRSEPALKIIHTLSPSAPGGLFASDAPLAGAQHRQVVERFFSPVAKLPHAWQLIERLECQIICRHAGDVVPACASGQIKPHSIACQSLLSRVELYCSFTRVTKRHRLRLQHQQVECLAAHTPDDDACLMAPRSTMRQPRAAFVLPQTRPRLHSTDNCSPAWCNPDLSHRSRTLL